MSDDKIVGMQIIHVLRLEIQFFYASFPPFFVSTISPLSAHTCRFARCHTVAPFSNYEYKRFLVRFFYKERDEYRYYWYLDVLSDAPHHVTGTNIAITSLPSILHTQLLNGKHILQVEDLTKEQVRRQLDWLYIICKFIWN